MKYKCKKEFTVDRYDDSGFPTGDYSVVGFGSVWERDNDTNIIGGEIHLENLETMEWLEIPRETLETYFEEV